MSKKFKYSHLTETEYLYGIKLEEFLELPYKTAVRLKHKSGQALELKLYYKSDKDFEDEVRLFKVRKAVKHNEKLIREWE